MKRTALTALLVLMAAPAPALALEPINREKHINDTLLQGFIASAIDNNCDTLSGRKLRTLAELWSLKDYALDKGYSRAEVTEFVENRDEKASRKAAAAAWLKARGAVPGQGAAYCDIGQAEIAKGSLIGRLLRSDG